MINQTSKNLKIIICYITTVLLTAWSLEIYLINKGHVGGLILVMWLPFFSAVFFKLIQYKSFKSIFSCMMHKLNLKSILFSIIYPILIIFICTVLALVSGIGNVNPEKNITIPTILTQTVLISLTCILTFGEEYGWRGYLLPELIKVTNITKATFITGIVWGAFHIPAIYLIAKTSGIKYPILPALVQATAAFSFSFAFSYCHCLSKNLFPAVLMHSVWNNINPLILGDIYKTKPGLIDGNVFYFNGEGVLGALTIAVSAFLFIKQFHKCKKDQVNSSSLLDC